MIDLLINAFLQFVLYFLAGLGLATGIEALVLWLRK